MDTKFTSGPWTFIIEDGDSHIMANSNSIMCDMQYYPWVPQNTYDWHLIAAAPDLYGALEYMLAVCPAIDDIGEEAIEEARQALAKARGK